MSLPSTTAPRVALLLNNPFVTDSRAWKMARSLASSGYRVTVVAREGAGLPATEEIDGFRVVRVVQPRHERLRAPGLPPEATASGEAGPSSARRAARPMRLVRESVGRFAQAGRYLLLTRQWARAIERVVPESDLWQAEGLVTLPVALELRRRHGGQAIYDARDLDVQSARFARLPGPWRRLLQRRERAWARSADGLLTVSRAYADVLSQTLGREPTIVMNGPPDFEPPEPREYRLHDRVGLPHETPVVLFLGQVLAHRGLEELCLALGDVPRAALVIAGFGADYERIQQFATGLPHADRIRFLPGVPPAEILPLTASADVSAMPVQPSTLNHELNTPTKLFDAMGAGVPVVASDLPGMAPIVRETGCGVLCDPSDPSDIARAIREIVDAGPERRAAYRRACLEAARGAYSWDRQARVLVELYRSLGLSAGRDDPSGGRHG